MNIVAQPTATRRGGEPWCPAEDRYLLRLRDHRKSWSEIARILGRSPSAVRIRRRYLADSAQS